MHISLPEGLRWAESAAEEAGFEVKNGVVPKRWADERSTIFVIRDLIESRRRKAAESLAVFKEAMAERRAAEPPKPPKPEFGRDLVIKAITGSRRPGSGAYDRFEAMKKFHAANPRASVAEIIKATGYRKEDYLWDCAKNNIATDVK